MDEIASPAGQRAAADYLRQLLLKPGPYRDAWRQHVHRPRDGVINQHAVTEVVAQSLRSRGPLAAAPDNLRDTVSRALAGRQLTRMTMRLLIEAFELADHDAARAWRLWNGDSTIRVLSGTRAIPDHDERTLSDIVGPRQHRLVSLHDHIGISAAGLVESLHVVEIVEALANQVGRIPFLTSTDVLTLEVGKGCEGISADIRQVTDTLFLTYLELARTLELGETLTVEYWVTWPTGSLSPSNPRDREYRRGVMGQVMSYDARIEFHPEGLPSHLWWATWDGVEGVMLTSDEATLDSQHSAHRYLQSVTKAAVGFYWSPITS